MANAARAKRALKQMGQTSLEKRYFTVGWICGVDDLGDKSCRIQLVVDADEIEGVKSH